MYLTPEQADAFGDWLELDRIRDALLAARPTLHGALSLDEIRPLLRIRLSHGAVLLVARSAEDSPEAWIVGAPGIPTPTLREASSPNAVVDTVVEMLAALETE